MKIITINNFRIGYGNEEILHLDHLTIEKNSITGLLGPSGSGKTSLLNAILKQNFSPSYWQKGEIYFENNLMNKSTANDLVGHIPQKARLYTDSILNNLLDGTPLIKKASIEKRKSFAKKAFDSLGIWHLFKDILDSPVIKQSLGIHKILLIVKAVIKKPKLLLIDEILASTSVKDEKIIIELIKKLKDQTSVLIITHNKDEAKELCDSIALVSGGILHEHTACEQFFNEPASNIGKEFLQSGSAWYTNPNQSTPPKEDNLTALRRFSSMCEFYWIISEKLGGMQKPGLMTLLDDDLRIMKQLKVNILVSLQQNPIDATILKKYQIIGMHFPITDMGVPSLQETYDFFKTLNPLIQEKSIIYHCKAGMGRTGTMLACHLLWTEDISAIQAIEEIRHINYKYIQTKQQMEFVSEFEKFLEENNN